MPDKLREALEKSNHALKAVEEWASKDGENMPNLKVLIATNEAALAAEPPLLYRDIPPCGHDTDVPCPICKATPQASGRASMDSKHAQQLVHKIRWAETAEEGMHLLADALAADAERVRRETFEEAAEIAQADTSTDTHGASRIAARLRALALEQEKPSGIHD